jgi:hypothetical protein
MVWIDDENFSHWKLPIRAKPTGGGGVGRHPFLDRTAQVRSGPGGACHLERAATAAKNLIVSLDGTSISPQAGKAMEIARKLKNNLN